MDVLDLSQLREERDREIALAQHAARRASMVTPSDGLCVECDEPIEAGRLKALGATEICSACAHMRELAGRRHG